MGVSGSVAYMFDATATLADIRNYPLLSPDEDDVSRIIDGLINRSIYQSVKNWTVAEPCFATRSRFNGYKNA